MSFPQGLCALRVVGLRRIVALPLYSGKRPRITPGFTPGTCVRNPVKSEHIRTLPSDIAGITCRAPQRVCTLHANGCQAQNLTCRLLLAGKLRTYNRPRFPGSAQRSAATRTRHKGKPKKASQTLKHAGANPCTLKNLKCDYDRRYSDISSPPHIGSSRYMNRIIISECKIKTETRSSLA